MIMGKVRKYIINNIIYIKNNKPPLKMSVYLLAYPCSLFLVLCSVTYWFFEGLYPHPRKTHGKTCVTMCIIYENLWHSLMARASPLLVVSNTHFWHGEKDFPPPCHAKTKPGKRWAWVRVLGGRRSLDPYLYPPTHAGSPRDEHW